MADLSPIVKRGRGRPRKVVNEAVASGEPLVPPASPPASSDLPPDSHEPQAQAPNLKIAELNDKDGHPPLRHADGTINRLHFQSRLGYVNRKQLEALAGDGRGIQGYEALKRGILAEAEMLGLTDRDVMDERSDHDRTTDLIRQLLDNPQSLFEAADKTLDALELQIRTIVDESDVRLSDVRSDLETKVAEYRGRKHESEQERLRLGKQWLNLLHRLSRLRRLVKNKVPQMGDRWEWQRDKSWDAAYEASWPWRVAIYVYRSDLENESEKPESQVLRMARHHAIICTDVWGARYGVGFRKATRDKSEIDNHPELFVSGDPRARVDILVTKRPVYRGVVVICPPGHGKSTFGQGWLLTEMISNPRMQGFMVHAVEPEAKKNFAHIKAAFDVGTVIGRRCVSLFDLRLDRKVSNKDDSMRLMLRERTRDPQLRAKGVRSGVGGSNCLIQWWDDPVEQEEAKQSDAREATHKKLAGEYLSRQRSGNTFVLVTATLWHHDDAVARLVRDIRLRKIKWELSLQSVGGPRSTPPFKPLWPEEYPAAKLKQRYGEMNDPQGWSAQYMANPKPEELRIVKRIALYDPRQPTHAGFLSRSQFHLSLDPSATSKDSVKRHTDKSGLVYAAVGDVMIEREGGGVEATTRIRIIDAKEFYASPLESVDAIAEYAKDNRVDMVHYEQIGTIGTTIGDLICNRYGLSSSQVIGHKFGNKSKEIRLRACAAMLDDSTRDQGLPGAVVEFPCVWVNKEGDEVDPMKIEPGDEARPVIDPRLSWFEQQVVNFGAVSGDHALDACTQLCLHLRGEVDVGAGGIVTQAINYEPTTQAGTWRRRMEESYRESDQVKPEGDVWKEEMAFLSGAGEEDGW